MACVYLSQTSDERDGIDIIPLTELDELSPAGREILLIYRDAIISSLGDPRSTFRSALDNICVAVRRDNNMAGTVERGIARRKLAVRNNNPNEHQEQGAGREHEGYKSDDSEEELSLC